MSRSNLLMKLGAGDISNIVPDVKAALAGPGNSSLAHRLLARISNLSMKQSDGSEPILSDDSDVLLLVTYCCQSLDEDSASVDKIESNSRSLAAFWNILNRFRANSNTLCAVKTLIIFLPIVEKMSLSETDLKFMNKFVHFTYGLALTTADDSNFKELSQTELSPIFLWELMLRVCSLTQPDISITYVLPLMRNLSVKYENCHGLNDTEAIVSFNHALLGKLTKFFQSKLTKLVANEELVNKAFSLHVRCLWQFLRCDIKSGTIANVYHTLSLMSEFATSFFSAHSDHVEYSNMISKLIKTFHFDIDCPPEEEFFINEVKALLEILDDKKREVLSPAFMWVLFIGGCAIASMDPLKMRTAPMKSFFTTAVLSSIQCFSKSLSKQLLSSRSSLCLAPNGDTCPFEGDAFLAFRTVNMLLTLCLDWKKDSNEEWTEILPLIQESLDILESILRVASEGKCVREQGMKDMLNDSHIRMGIQCYNTNNWECGSRFLLPLLKYLNPVGQNVNSALEQRILSILPALTICYEKQGLKKETKATVILMALMHLKYKTPQKFSREKWSFLQNDDITAADTTEQFLQKESRLMKSMCPQFKLNKELACHLMLWELSCYALHKVNDTNFILNSWLALKASNPSAALLLEGSALACKALLSCNDKVDWYDLLSASLSCWLPQIEQQEKAVGLCSMASHYFMKFLIMAHKHLTENESIVEDVNIYSQHPSSVRRPQDVINPSDVCQIRSSFPNLNLHREQKLMEILDTSVNYWKESLEAGLSVENYTLSPIVTASGEYILQIAYLYLLWGHNVAAAKAFHICCKFARKMALDDLLLQALSGLMTTVEVEQECIKEAEGLLEKLKDHPKFSYLEKVYFTSSAFQALRTGAYIEGVKSLKAVSDFNPTPTTVWCYSSAKLLQASYALLPKSKLDKYQLGGSECAFAGLIYSIHNIQDRRLAHSPLLFAAVVHHALSTALWIGRYYLRRQMPREARAYLKPELILALKLGLATRAAEFICELAFVDLITENVDDAVAKTIDLKSILGDIESQDDSLKDEITVDSVERPSAHEILQVPQQGYTGLGASPTLAANEVFRIPILQHGPVCTCYMCKNVSVQNVWLMNGHLQAKINTLCYCAHNALGTYKETFKAAEIVKKKINKNAVSTKFLLQQHEVSCSMIYSKLDFVDMLVMYGKDAEAVRQNGLILGLLSDLKTHESQLLAEALEQKMCIFKILEQKETKVLASRASRTSPNVNNVQTSPRVLDKTPEKSELFTTPAKPGMKRPPLKPVGCSKHLLVPLTNQQFFSPKAEINLGLMFSSDEEENKAGQHFKENVSTATSNNLKTAGKLRKVFGNTDLSSDSDDVEATKVVETSKVSKPIRKPRTTNAPKETLPVDDKLTSIRKSSAKTTSANSKPLSVRGVKTAKEDLPPHEKPTMPRRTSTRSLVPSRPERTCPRKEPLISISEQSQSDLGNVNLKKTESSKPVKPVKSKLSSCVSGKNEATSRQTRLKRN